MLRGNAGTHWLVDIARRAGLPGADALEIPPDAPLSAAWDAVAAQCHVTVQQLAEEVAESLHLPIAQLAQREPHVHKLLPEKFARRYHVVALRETDRQIVVATADPLNDEVERGVGFASGRTALFEIAAPEQIEEALACVFRAPATAAPALTPAAKVKLDSHVTDAQTLEDAVRLVQNVDPETLTDDDSAAAPVIKLTNLILRNAVHERASDIHFEPSPTTATVRFRVDGIMRVHMRMPLLALQRVVSRIKVKGGLDIADRLRPQDGRAGIEIDGRHMDLRISTVPTRDAEKCVVRLLRGASDEKLPDLHLAERDLRLVRSLIGYHSGIVIVTGPTGSGKTTTLYAAIRELDNGETNISTVEDPIEYELPGITQMQVEIKRDFTFANALRAILRQDPDVILIGEVRDLETGSIAVQASMTGHLVLTTMHTNDAAGAVSRLSDIGVERTAIAATLRGVVAQRLMRRVCPHCVERLAPGALDETERRLAASYATTPVVRAHGCAACGQSGYLGRMGIFEILTVNAAMQELISRGGTALEIQRAASLAGMRTLRASALQRVADGETTLQEVERVIGEMQAEEAPAPAELVVALGPRVLIVDDDAVCRMTAKRLLREGRCEVVEAASGEEALAILEADHEIALCVLDLGLPGMQGEEVLARLRSTPIGAGLPVIVLTGSPDPDLEIGLMEAGADDYIRKPLEARRFVARVRAALRRSAAA